jgi:hypothetical protein
MDCGVVSRGRFPVAYWYLFRGEEFFPFFYTLSISEKMETTGLGYGEHPRGGGIVALAAAIA